MAIFTVDENGISVPSLDDAKTDITATFQRLFGDDLALDAQTPQGQLVGIFATAYALIGEILVDLANTTDPDKVVGIQQDVLYKLLNVDRIQATRSRVVATVTGVAGITVPLGSRARTAAGAEFQTVDAVILAPSPGVTVVMESVDTGPVEATAGTLTNIVSVTQGWETVNNAADAILGRNAQSSPEYRQTYFSRTARNSTGYLDSIRAALTDALVTRDNTYENRTSAAEVVQEWTVNRHAILAIAEGGIDADITRAIENTRTGGSPTMSAIRGGTPDNSALDSVTNGTVNWNGTDYTGLNLSAAGTGALKAAALTILLAGDAIPPTVAYIDGRYVCQFEWRPAVSPQFADGTVESDFGLNMTDATPAPGPFVRPHERALTVTVTVTRQPGFPADGLNAIRSAVTSRVAGYDVGEQLWSNDLLVASETIAGTRVTAISVQYNGVDVSGISPPLDIVWALPAANLTVTVT